MAMNNAMLVALLGADYITASGVSPTLNVTQTLYVVPCKKHVDILDLQCCE